MVWDLGKAMRKKEEFESARVTDFEYRQRARAARILAQQLGLDEAELARATASHNGGSFLTMIAGMTGQTRGEIAQAYRTCLSVARGQLIAERGDPTPHRLG
jgi:hypothetical protein